MKLHIECLQEKIDNANFDTEKLKVAEEKLGQMQEEFDSLKLLAKKLELELKTCSASMKLKEDEIRCLDTEKTQMDDKVKRHERTIKVLTDQLQK